MYINEDGLDFRDPYERQIILQQRQEELAEKLKEKKECNKTYLKGQRGVRRYYDYDIPVIQGKDGKEIRQIKCVYTRDKRLKSMFEYFEYLKGKKILVRDLAWKYAVTVRTIQNDLKYLIDNGFIKRQINKTYLNRQTKNSYIVNPEKKKDLPFTDDCFVHPIVVAKQNDNYYIVTQTDYDESKVVRGYRNIESFFFELSEFPLTKISDIDKISLTYAGRIFGNDISLKYYGEVYSYIANGKDVDEDTKKVYDRWTNKLYFSLIELDELYPPKEGYKWITLKVAPRRIKRFDINKGLHYITKEILGVK